MNIGAEIQLFVLGHPYCICKIEGEIAPGVNRNESVAPRCQLDAAQIQEKSEDAKPECEDSNLRLC